MKVSDYIAGFLEFQGIDTVFEMAGGMITHLLDSMAQNTSIRIVSMHHEQAASFAADAYGRVTGRPGVALATSGPGATNLVTGIGSCYFDSSPAVFITGQVNTHEQKGDRQIRQLGFQETDVVSIVEPITKATYRITDAHQVPRILHEAFQIALSGRPGPVLIDIPMNMQRVEIDPLEFTWVEKTIATTNSSVTYADVLSMLRKAARPIILAGAGIRAASVHAQFLQWCQLSGVPVVTSLMAVDLLPFADKQKVGFLGSYGNRWANLTVGAADFVLVLGSRLDIRQTGADTKFFENKCIVHVDCEAGEINNRITTCVAVHEDLQQFLPGIINEWNKQQPALNLDSWFQQINNWKEQWPDINEAVNCKGINPNKFIHALSEKAPGIKAWLADVGNHQMWTAQSLENAKDQLFLTSGGMGAMGFALPAAIGACMALHNQPVCVICGDGGFQLNLQELQTIVRNQLPIKMIILNNQNLGMIRQFQDSYFDSRYQSTYWGYSAPDFEAVAKAYKIDARTISYENEVGECIDWLQLAENAGKPQLLQVMIDPHVNAYPKIAFGKPLTEMEPYASPIEMEGT